VSKSTVRSSLTNTSYEVFVGPCAYSHRQHTPARSTCHNAPLPGNHNFLHWIQSAGKTLQDPPPEKGPNQKLSRLSLSTGALGTCGLSGATPSCPVGCNLLFAVHFSYSDPSREKLFQVGPATLSTLLGSSCVVFSGV
jgi:hypothetical protein